MMRISREEEHYIGRGRPSLNGRIKAGLRQGRPHHRLWTCTWSATTDLTTQAGDFNMAGRIVSLLYQPPAMRWRGISVLTNTVPRSAQSSPGGMQGITLMEPLLAKAARQLNVDQVEIRKINAPEGKALWGPPAERQARLYHQLLPEECAG